MCIKRRGGAGFGRALENESAMRFVDHILSCVSAYGYCGFDDSAVVGDDGRGRVAGDVSIWQDGAAGFTFCGRLPRFDWLFTANLQPFSDSSKQG